MTTPYKIQSIYRAISITKIFYQGFPFWAHIDGTAVPNMLPMEVCEFQMPRNSPRCLLPNQLPITATTPGQPVD